MYQAEVPQYGTLLELVECVNQEMLGQQPELYRRLEAQGELARLSVERHGAIRVGTAGELSMLRRLFAVMGMYPVGYYDPKAVIEGPPHRECAILLRQTSFKALEESIRFAGDTQGTHTARFGEVEQRGVALTPKGRALYDQLLNDGRKQATELDNDAHQAVRNSVFAAFPDSDQAMRREGLAYFHYHLTDAGQAAKDCTDKDTEALIAQGLIEAQPITYEDFLPVSAAGIFQSSLGGAQSEAYVGSANRDSFEEALGA
ncbi:hypothetical protein MELB17_12501 [Marinobacter sp. ELB17]|nr:hypothetical protein MELB17_12501 [Marinobacter sp. ELB17]